jgi:hypothetical protein
MGAAWSQAEPPAAVSDDVRLGVAGLLTIASTFLLVSGIAYACYVATQTRVPARIDNAVLGEALVALANVAVLAGILALAAILVEWFALQHRLSDPIGRIRGPLLLATVLGLLVFAAGLAGVAGAALNASARPTAGWYTLEQVALGVGAVMLGIAVALSSAWSLRTLVP